MENNYEQLKIEFVETKKVSLAVKILSFCLLLFFVFTPLYEVIPELLICDCVELLPPGSCNFAGNNCPH